jgi:hypothetical protein
LAAANRRPRPTTAGTSACLAGAKNGVLRQDRQVEQPELARPAHRQQPQHAAGPNQVDGDHGAAALPAVGEDPGQRPEQQRRQGLGDHRRAGGDGRAGEVEHVGGDRHHQQPAPEVGAQPGRPEQPEVPHRERLQHRHASALIFSGNDL